MPTSIDRDEVQRLIAEEDAQLVEVLPGSDYEKEHITGAIRLSRRFSASRLRHRPVLHGH
jgi:rhodanese-related sulfurtransferase